MDIIQLNNEDRLNQSFSSNYSTKSRRRNENQPTILDKLREFFTLLNSVESEGNSLNRNFIVTGEKGSGKSSLIEYFLSFDIFPKKLPDSDISFKIQILSKDVDEISFNCQNQNMNYLNIETLPTEKFATKLGLITVNGQKYFENSAELQKYYSEVGISSLKNEHNLIDYIIFSDKKISEYSDNNLINLQNVFLNFSVYEIGLEKLNDDNSFTEEIINLNNKTVLLCVNSRKYNTIQENLEIIKNKFSLRDNDNILIIFNKPIEIESQKHYDEVEKYCKDSKLNFCFVNMRSKEERYLFDKISDYQRYEHKFYKEVSFFKNILKNEVYGYMGIFTNMFKIVLNDLVKNKDTIEHLITNSLVKMFNELRSLGDGNDSDLKIKKEKLKSSFKNLILNSKINLQMQNSLIKSFIENILHGVDIEEKKIQEKFESSKFIREMIQVYSTNFTKICYDSTTISNLINSQFVTGMTSKDELLKKINSVLINTILEKSKSALKNIFIETIKEMNIKEITENIDRSFPFSKSEFKNNLSETIQDAYSQQMREAYKIINYYNELEDNLLLFSKQEYMEEFSRFYEDVLMKNKFVFDDKFTDFLKPFLSKICRDKMNTILENTCKIFSYYYYAKLSYKLEQFSFEEIITSNFQGSLDQSLRLEEGEDMKHNRECVKNELDIIFNMHDLFKNLIAEIQSSKAVPFISDLCFGSPAKGISGSILNQKFSRSNSGIKNKKPAVRNIESYEYLLKKKKISFEEWESNSAHESLFDSKINRSLCFQNVAIEDDDINRKFTKQTRQSTELFDINGKEENLNELTEISSIVKFASNEIAMICDNTNQIKVFNCESNLIEKEIVDNIPNGKFLENNRYLNVGDKVYIAGGKTPDGKISKLFIELKRPENEISRLPDLIENLSGNSMIYAPEENSIILVGGTDSKNTFIYQIPEKKWNDFGRLRIKREDPSLFLLNNSTIICFGGIKCNDERKFANLIEYKLIYENHWKSCNFDINDSLINFTKLSGAGIIPVSEHQLIINGGYNSEDMSDEKNAYKMSILSDYPLKLKVEISEESESKGENKILSWFPENNYVLSEDKKSFFNFNLDEEIILYNLENKDFYVIQSN
jgi:hypothetical protein